MPEVTLVAEIGRAPGSSESGRLRAQGKIPAVLYGHGITPIPLAVDARDLRAVLTTEAGSNALLNLRIDGAEHLAMARELQRHPVRHNVIHVDFLLVSRDEVLSADVPIVLVGEAEDLHRAGGIVAQEQFALTIQATPGRIPSSIEIDISGLEIGSTIRVADIALPEGVATDHDPDLPLVTGQAPTVEEVPEPEEGEEPEEGAEAAEGGAEAEGSGEASGEAKAEEA